MTTGLSAHTRSVLLMLLVGVLWSTAGVATRFLTPELLHDHPWEMVFWRSGVCSIVVFLFVLFGLKQNAIAELIKAGRVGILSSLMWAGMSGLFLIALAYTTVTHVFLITALGPMLAAILARIVLKTHVPLRTWIAILIAWSGLAWMVTGGGKAGALPDSTQMFGIFIALLVPCMSSTNLVILQGWGKGKNMIPSVGLGGVFASLIALLFMDGFHATASDILVLSGLGVFQLGIPCALMVIAAKNLIAPEVALLGRIETVLGPTWAWIFAGETPSSASIVGGLMILSALVGNELIGSWERLKSKLKK